MGGGGGGGGGALLIIILLIVMGGGNQITLNLCDVIYEWPFIYSSFSWQAWLSWRLHEHQATVHKLRNNSNERSRHTNCCRTKEEASSITEGEVEWGGEVDPRKRDQCIKVRGRGQYLSKATRVLRHGEVSTT